MGVRAPEELDALCIYCQRQPAASEDHIPPKALFPDHTHPALFTVPSCVSCNRGASKDDELFREMLCLWIDHEVEPRIEEVWAASQRALYWRPRYGGLLAMIRQQIVPVTLQTPTGLIVEGAGLVRLPADRMRNVLRRVVKALTYRHAGVALPVNYQIAVAFGSAVGPNRARDEAALAEMRPHLVDRPVHELAGGCFKYKFATAIDSPLSSTWEFVFYDRILFGALVATG